jgi:hypothetical protein
VRALCALPAVLLLAACARKLEAAPPVAGEYKLSAWLSLPKDDPGHVSSRSPEQIVDGVIALESRIGYYPARFSDDADRQAAYQTWSALILDARAAHWPSEPDARRLWVFGELYRQGYNLDVRGAGELAEQTLSECVSKFPQAPPCSLSLVEFYLSLKPTAERLARAEQILAHLRVVFGPKPNEGLEAEVVHLRIVQGDAPGAQRAIDAYLEEFPNGKVAEQFRRVRAELDEGIEPPPELEP